MALSTISGTTGITDGTITSAKLADFTVAVDLNGVELLLDADQDTSITADTDDQIDFKIAGVEHISLTNSAGDTVIKPRVDGKDIIFQQYDGNKILEINDANYVAISGAAAGPGELRFYEDTDLGTHYTGLKAGNATASVSYVLPLADGTSGYQLTTDGSGTLTWAAAGATVDNNSNNRILTATGSTSLNGEANLTFDGSTLTNAGATQLNSTLTIGANDQGYDIIIYGDTASANVTWDTSVDDLIFNGAARAVIPDGQLVLGSTAVTSTAAELNLLDNVSGLVQADLTKLAALDATATEINLIDGGTSAGTTAVADADGIITNDGGTMRLTTAATFKTYFQEGISQAYDDFTIGDAAVLITTSAGNITIDAAANDSDIIFKGTDGGADTTYMTIDGSAGGDLFLTGGLIDLKNDGSAVSQIKFYCESSNAHAQTLIGAPHSESANNVLTLPGTGGDARLVSTASTATLTNKTLTSPVINTGTFGTSILPVSANGTTLGSASKEFADLFLSDGGQILFGADQDVTLTHVADVGLALKSIATADDKPVILTLQTGETDIAANDVIGAIDFQAPDEGTGTDAILVAAGIEAVSEGDFSSSSNATSLVFKTGASEAAAGKIKVTSAGHLFPMADDSYDLGGASNQWRNIYTGDLHLSNMSKAEGNVVDGTKGDWTIQEGSDELYLMNNNSGKKYKFNLTEV
jgi:hypothetical protein